MRNKKISIFTFILVIVFFFNHTVTVFAGGSSDERTITLKGYTYRFWSIINNPSTGEIFAQTTLDVVDKEAPTGYIGARARLYSSGGTLVNYTSWKYNTEKQGCLLVHSNFKHSSGYYYSKGQVKLYNGNGYTTYSCYATPNYSPTSANVSTISTNIDIQRNAKGEVYGSEIFLNQMGIEPDLILAEGNDGIIGYVRAEDLETDNVQTLDEAIDYMDNSTFSYRIPLYASDGKTVIGAFTIG